MKYKKKMTFEARRLFAKTRDAIKEWAGGNAWFYDSNGDSELYVLDSDRGGIAAEEGDWIVRDEHDEYQVYKPDEFQALFEPVESST